MIKQRKIIIGIAIVAIMIIVSTIPTTSVEHELYSSNIWIDFETMYENENIFLTKMYGYYIEKAGSITEVGFLKDPPRLLTKEIYCSDDELVIYLFDADTLKKAIVFCVIPYNEITLTYRFFGLILTEKTKTIKEDDLMLDFYESWTGEWWIKDGEVSDNST